MQPAHRASVWGGYDGRVVPGPRRGECAGGLREALEAEDYATAVDEAQRRRWLPDVALGMSCLYPRGRGASRPQDVERPPRRLAAAGKVSDFGLSQSESLNTAATSHAVSDRSARRGRQRTWRPSSWSRTPFTEETDVYAYALVIWEVLTGDIHGAASTRCSSECKS